MKLKTKGDFGIQWQVKQILQENHPGDIDKERKDGQAIENIPSLEIIAGKLDIADGRYDRLNNNTHAMTEHRDFSNQHGYPHMSLHSCGYDIGSLSFDGSHQDRLNPVNSHPLPRMCRSSTPERSLMNIPLNTPLTNARSKVISPIIPQERQPAEDQPKCKSAPPVLSKSRVCQNLSQFFGRSSPYKCNQSRLSYDDVMWDGDVISDAAPLAEISSLESSNLFNLKSNSYISESLSSLLCEGHTCHMQEEIKGTSPVQPTSDDCFRGCAPVNSATSFNTLGSEGPICRICHEGDCGEEEKLFKPCRCSGTLSYTHQKCLERWLQTKNQDVCELCQFQFRTKRESRPFKEWLQRPTHPRDRQNIMMDVLCFCLLTPMVFCSAWLCLHGARYYLTYFENRDLEGIGLIVLATVLLTIFVFWSAVSLRYHCGIWNNWRAEHQLIHIVVDGCTPDKAPSLLSHSLNMNHVASDEAIRGTYV